MTEIEKEIMDKNPKEFELSSLWEMLRGISDKHAEQHYAFKDRIYENLGRLLYRVESSKDNPEELEKIVFQYMKQFELYRCPGCGIYYTRYVYNPDDSAFKCYSCCRDNNEV